MSRENPAHRSTEAPEKIANVRTATDGIALTASRTVIRRAQADPNSLTRADVLRLQRSIGNRATGRLLASSSSVQMQVQASPAQETGEQQTDAAPTVTPESASPVTVRRAFAEGALQAQRKAYFSQSTPLSGSAPAKIAFGVPPVQRELSDDLLRGLHKRRQAAMGMSEEDALEEEGGAGEMLEKRQANDSRYQDALTGIRESTVDEGMPSTRSEKRHRQVWNRRERQLGPALKDQRERQFFEGRIAERNSELTGFGKGPSILDRAKGLETLRENDRLAQEDRRQADEEARPLVEGRMAGIDEESQLVLRRKFKRVNTDVLAELVKRKRELARDDKWSALNEILTEIHDESAKINSYENALDGALDRIKVLGDKVPHKITYGIRNTEYAAFESQVKKRIRDETATNAALGVLNNALQVQEDKIAQDQSTATERRRLRDNGLWPANNRPAAQIAEATRATLGGSDEERAAVVEALDALKTGADHSWARKWGAYHGNGEGNLPGAAAGLGGYKEYYVRPDGTQVGQVGVRPAGTRRLVVSDSTGFVYYSDNHYGAPNGRTLPAFVKVTDA